MPLEARIKLYHALIFPFSSCSNATPYIHTSNFFHALKIFQYNDIYKYLLALYVYSHLKPLHIIVM